ncbi:MAG TPA: sigma-70 family RNA polymerase sigma factor [Candidatus Gastranaerophilaceae bacterium]|nr:sigma-70 family RNA polymerase sigma factor [Candidatus Gastranaerophilaceae bacterium]HPT41396.1 sigma-70 family RNA polymerase sigma factor [Candidatus Gastranaerophilaceae bacterium]
MLGKLPYKKIPMEELVMLSQKSDYRALEELIKREQKNIFAAFSYLSKKRENIADLTQEALLRMARGISNLKNPKTFKSWLNQIVTNLFYDDLRKSTRRPETISIDNDENENPYHTQIPDTKHRPMEKIMSSELDRLIKEEIQNLPDHFRIAIILRELQGLTYEEIANATNTNVGTVKSRIARAREKLQDGLKHYI